MRLVLVLLSIFIITSCSLKKEISKLYGKCEKHYFVCTQIEINPDGTFEYFVFMDVGGKTIRKGTWSQYKGNTLLLNTYDQPKNKTTTYKGVINPSLKKKVKISIGDFEQKLGLSVIEINDGEMVKSTDENGTVVFETNQINNITYHYLGYSEKIKISNPEFNEIDILIRDLDSGIPSIYLTDMPIVATNRKVIFYPNNSEKKFEIERTQMKRKQWK